ncbi:MAG TPA: nitroreductase family protein [Thermomicrobiales bacterium]|nr:nitroreductase family protein [Thermomicrobiales bacterium]
MDFLEVVRRRRMVRRFTDEPVPWETVERIVRVAQRAPSAGYSQGVSFVAIDDAETRARVAEIVGEAGYVAAGFGPFVSSAPVQIVVCTSEEIYRARYREPDKRRAGARANPWPVPYWHTDAGAALMLVLLAVVNEGLASAFVGVRDPDAVRAELGIPDDHMPIGVVAIGHPAPDRRSSSLKRGRKPLESMLHRNRW